MAVVSKLNMVTATGAPANSAAVSKLTMIVTLQLGTEAGATAPVHRAFTYAQRVRDLS